MTKKRVFSIFIATLTIFGFIHQAAAAARQGKVIVQINLNAPPEAKNDKPLNEDLYGFNIGYKIMFKEQ